MSPEPLEGEPRRRLIAVTRRRAVLATTAVLAALWLGLVRQFVAGDDPVVGDPAASAGATQTTPAETETTPAETETTPAETETTPAETETTPAETETETTPTETTETTEEPAETTTAQS